MNSKEKNEEVRLLEAIGARLDLSDFQIEEVFTLYKLHDNYDFESNLGFNDKNGTYIFTKKEGRYHQLIYCGKTEHLNKRFYDHCNGPCIMKHNADYIAVCFCDTDEDAIKLENKILGLIPFPCNTQKNKKCTCIKEVPEVSIIR